MFSLWAKYKGRSAEEVGRRPHRRALARGGDRNSRELVRTLSERARTQQRPTRSRRAPSDRARSSAHHRVADGDRGRRHSDPRLPALPYRERVFSEEQEQFAERPLLSVARAPERGRRSKETGDHLVAHSLALRRQNEILLKRGSGGIELEAGCHPDRPSVGGRASGEGAAPAHRSTPAARGGDERDETLGPARAAARTRGVLRLHRHELVEDHPAARTAVLVDRHRMQDTPDPGKRSISARGMPERVRP